MREIIFRGKNRNNEWVYGSLTVGDFDCWIADANCRIHIVDPDTIGEFTGEYDKYHRRIFEGDYVLRHYFHVRKAGTRRTYYYTKLPLKVRFEAGVFSCGRQDKEHAWWKLTQKGIEVVGNIYDNPELDMDIPENKERYASEHHRPSEMLHL